MSLSDDYLRGWVDGKKDTIERVLKLIDEAPDIDYVGEFLKEALQPILESKDNITEVKE